jgi:hypothetical protein
MPSREELLDRYARLSGLPIDEMDYYVILGRFKLAIALEAGYARYVQGGADNPKMAMLGNIVLDRARERGGSARGDDRRGATRVAGDRCRRGAHHRAHRPPRAGHRRRCGS